MARRELSDTLKNLKFMQRGSLREEKIDKDDDVKSHTKIPITSTTTTTKCVVLMEGDPHPSTLKGRMSFQNFNPYVDKLNADEEKLSQPATQPKTTISRNQSENASIRENSTLVEGKECSNLDKKSYKVNGNAKRKQGEVIFEAKYPSKSAKKCQGNRQSSSNHSLVYFKKPRGDVLDWNALRSAKCQTK